MGLRPLLDQSFERGSGGRAPGFSVSGASRWARALRANSAGGRFPSELCGRFPSVANETERLRSLRSYNILDTSGEEAFDDLTRLAAQICNAPIALIGFMDEHRHWIKSHVGIPWAEIPRQDSFARQVIESEAPLEVEDAVADPRFANLTLVTGPAGVRFYAGMPLQARQGAHVLGTLCVMDRQPRRLTSEQVGALRILSHQVVTQLELRRNFIELELSIESHLRAEEALRRAEEKYRGIFENVMEGIFQTTPEGRYLSVIPMLARIYGYSSPEELVTSIGDISHELYVQPGRREEFIRLIRGQGYVTRFVRISPTSKCGNLSGISLSVVSWNS